MLVWSGHLTYTVLHGVLPYYNYEWFHPFDGPRVHWFIYQVGRNHLGIRASQGE